MGRRVAALAALVVCMAMWVGVDGGVAPARVAGSPYPAPSAGMNCAKTLDVVDTSSWVADDVLTVETLQGTTARVCPSIWRLHTQSYSTWQDSLQKTFNVTFRTKYAHSLSALLMVYGNQLKGYVVCNLGDESVNVALTLCAAQDGVIAVTSTNEGLAVAVGLPKLQDARSMHLADVIATYSTSLSTRMQSVQMPSKASYLAGYTVFSRAISWFDTNLTAADVVAALDHQDAPSALVGWGPDELNTVTALSELGLCINAADWALNLAVLTSFYLSSGLHQPTAPTAAPASAASGDAVHTVTFLMTDGDNVQWLLNGFDEERWYGSPDRGKVDLGWTLSPALAELAPTATQYYYSHATPGRDYFVGSVSGFGYMYPDKFAPQEPAAMTAFAETTARFMAKADQSILNVLEVEEDIDALSALTSQDAIDAIVLYLFSDYSGMHGRIEWSNGKPVIGGRFSLWAPQFYNVTQLAAALNEQARDPTVAAGYSLVPVHVWSQTVADVVAVQALLDDDIQVVTPREFVARVIANLQPSDKGQ